MARTQRWVGVVTLGFTIAALVVGGIAVWLGYRLGQEALSKVRQPTLNPVTPDKDPQPFVLLTEDTIIQQVQALMGTSTVRPNSPAPADPAVRLPLLALQEGGIYMALEAIDRQGDQAILRLRIQNERATAVQVQRQFIVRNAQGEILEVEVEGLPVQLAPGNQATAVRVKVPVRLGKVRVGLTEVGQTIPFIELRDIALEPVPSTPTPSPTSN
ncbi:MAG: hypothetical protein RMI89_07680 [Gloeomargarita sp. SKYBB_i_bin120]|nr:hypothetical protein [Gloeomargarita sp. SKYB120]MDW8178402.1 hypothetical protein [Gloeomargarita sp. SKYBB_i_bin120]